MARPERILLNSRTKNELHQNLNSDRAVRSNCILQSLQAGVMACAATRTASDPIRAIRAHILPIQGLCFN